MKALFYDDLESEEGCVVREMIDEHTALMKDGQHFDYLHSVTEENLGCRLCGQFNTLHFKGDYPEDVSTGYVAACMKCDADFYLFELMIDKN